MSSSSSRTRFSGPVLVDALRASLEATVVETESPARTARLAQTFTPDLLVVDPQTVGSLDGLDRQMPVLFTDMPPPGTPIEADRYAILPRPFRLEDFLAAADRLRAMEPA